MLSGCTCLEGQEVVVVQVSGDELPEVSVQPLRVVQQVVGGLSEGDKKSAEHAHTCIQLT